MADTEISVNAGPVVEASALRAIGELLAAVGDAHTPRALVRAIAASLATHLPLRRVELRSPGAIAIVERDAGDWRSVEPVPDPEARMIAPELAVVATRKLPPAFATAEFRASLAQVIAIVSAVRTPHGSSPGTG